MNLNSAYRPDIDGLRAIAVLVVVLNHLFDDFLPGGYVGVDVFFVISGYLITQIVQGELKAGTFTFARFYLRRARRIFPALFAMLAATVAAAHFVLLPSDYLNTLSATLSTLLFTSNILFWRELEAGYFADDAALNPLLHTWSLAVEEQFYLLFPVALLLVFRHARRHVAALLLAAAAVSLAGAAWFVDSRGTAVFFLSPFRAWELLAGALLAVVAVPRPTSRWLREALAGAGLLAIGLASVFYDNSTSFPGLTALAPVLGAVAIIHAGSGGRSAVGRLLRCAPLVYIGLISYSLYLWHWPVIVLSRYVPNGVPAELGSLALLAVSLVLASLSYHFVEQPFRHGPAARVRFSATASGALAGVLGLVCVAGLVQGGNAQRFTPAVLKLDAARLVPIAYLDCAGKPLDARCQLGRLEAEPTVLLWGDSHAMSWAPAWNDVLASRGEKADLSVTVACPPLLHLDNALNASCAPRNRAVQAHLLANPDIKTVVLSAFWSTYFRDDGPLSEPGDGDATPADRYALARALVATIAWLREQQRDVVVIGPVPVYEQSIPLALALEKVFGVNPVDASADAQHAKHAPFLDAIAQARRIDGPGSLRYLDPIAWLCDRRCALTRGGVSLYRDEHHLSVDGAMLLKDRLIPALSGDDGAQVK